MQLPSLRLSTASLCFALVAALGAGAGDRTLAQSLPNCQPPRANEYLLLVRNQKPDTQAQVQQLLPPSAVLTNCNYGNDNVVRVEAFASADIANAWVQYLNEKAGLQAVVARPPSPGQIGTAPSQPPTSNPAPSPAAPSATYNPQALGSGYAVIVNYFNRPEVAADVQQVTVQRVGLVAYEQRPYLLATYTTDPATASSILQTLQNRGFVAVIVDGRRTMLLSPSVAGN